MTRFHVVAIAAGLLLAVWDRALPPTDVRHEECREIAISRGQVQRFSDPPV